MADRTPAQLYSDNPIVPDDDTIFVSWDDSAAGASVFAGLKRGLSFHNSVDVATTGNITLSGEQTIDGVLTSASRVLVHQQSTSTQDGIYTSGAGAWTRVADLPTGDDASGIAVVVQQGTTYADKLAICTNNTGSGVVGTDDLVFTFFGTADAAISEPATNQVAITANGESVIVDNDAATPSFRPDVDNTWCLGESSFQWKCIQGAAGSLTDPTLEIAGEGGLYRSGANEISVTVDKAAAQLTTTTTQVKVNLNGTAAAPALTVRDAATGIWSAATNNLNLGVNNESVVVDNDGATPSLRGDVDDTWTLGEAALRYKTVFAGAGGTSTPSVAIREIGTGLYSPATNEVALVANGEYVVLDNGAATPSLRPDVDSTWDFGEDAIRWKVGYFDEVDAPTITGRRLAYEVRAANDPVWGGNVTLATALENTDSFGGVTLATGDVVLLCAQTAADENGPWVVAASGAPSRPSWFATGADPSNFHFLCTEGRFASRFFVCENAVGDVVDTSNLTIRLEPKVHRGNGAAPTSSNDAANGYHPGDLWLWEDPGNALAYINAGEDGGSPEWGDINSRSVRALGTSTFSLDEADAGRVCQWTGTSTGINGTIDQAEDGQVTTVVLTGTAGTITFVAGTGMTVEYEEGASGLTTNAPAAGTVVTVSIIWLSSTFAVVTGGLA